ncbi:hypothetical protein [Microbulbifer sp. GL-2]|uniref:hypothetical protein n=1 Tax=Microbulbifer sp. GL-2 TaxID=2591606 RepID=UPI001165420E|nr:hypothetical protein [Microbulbifer sp. GL-2]BBM01790.1 hypothetical protein GL2_18640 [Microbulbifer sp. GL-2]
MKIIIFLSLLFSELVFAEEQRQPLKTMSTCLIMNKWSSWGMWDFEVYALAREKILIGDKENHFLVTADEPGYRHVISGETIGTYPEAVTLNDLGHKCSGNCPVNHIKRVNWFKRRCKSYED